MTPYSWKIVTTANTSFNMPFECPPVAIWNDTVGAPKTAVIEGIWGGGVLLNDDEVFVELEHLADGASPLATLVNDGKANLLAAAAAQDASSATWVGIPEFTSFDGVNSGQVTLSNAGLTALLNASANWIGARSAAPLSSGKYYFEMKLVQNTAGSSNVGILHTTGAFYDLAGSATLCTIADNGGRLYTNSAGDTGWNIGVFAVNDVACFAIDLTARKAWIRRNGGNWNADAAANPATAAGATLTIGAGAFSPAVGFANTPAIGNGWTANFGATSFAQAVPAGFTAGWPASNWLRFKLSVPFTAAQKGWVYARVKCAKPSATFYIDPMVTLGEYVAPPVVYATWDPATVANVTLSGGNLIATNTGGSSSNQGARIASASGKTSGKYYFEIAFTHLVNNAAFSQAEIIAVAMSSTNYSSIVSTGDISLNYFGNMYLNGTNAGFNLGRGLASGDVIGIALDQDNHRIWFRIAPSGNWNNNAPDNPATNSGGINIATLTGPLTALTTFGGSGGFSGNIRTANFGATAFVGAVPAGFTAGWST